MATALVGTACIAFAYDLHTIALGFAVASLGFGLFRPGFTAGASLAVTRAEQGQVGGIVASLNGAAYIVAPALGVWLYNHHEAVGFAVIGGLCAAVLGWGWRALESDTALEAERR
jgi:predicted MFS family arabinose efflux permease